MTIQLSVRGVLFDMDGVLMSSLGSVERSWRKYALARDVDPEFAIKVTHGRRAIETIRHLRPDLDDVAELRVIEEMEMEDNEGLVVLPGVQKILASLPENSWAIVTSATERLARSRLAFAGIKIPKHFITGDTVTHGKPHPEPYLRGAALLGVAPQDCVVIEDAPTGVAAGKEAGCKVLAVLTTHASDVLTQADWCVSTLADVEATAQPDARVNLRFSVF